MAIKIRKVMRNHTGTKFSKPGKVAQKPRVGLDRVIIGPFFILFQWNPQIDWRTLTWSREGNKD